jgi:AraC-like DNA-binding protein
LDFQQTFLKCLKSSIALTKSITILDYLPQPITNTSSVKANLPYIQAYRNLSCTYPYYYMLEDLDSYCLLYTENGSGTLFIKDHSYLLPTDSLAFINCKELHRLEIKQNLWDYKVFFINGNPIPYLYNTLEEMGNVITLTSNSFVPNMIHKLLFQLDKNEKNPLIYSKIILDILFEVILENSRASDMNTHIPEYLIHIKKGFDTNYQINYSLDFLEQDYHISRYRICREFTKYFNISPIQYLNQRRISVAMDTLLHTDKRINEIGQIVGFENTNHFIRLFKKQNGIPPLEYRKRSSRKDYLY